MNKELKTLNSGKCLSCNTSCTDQIGVCNYLGEGDGFFLCQPCIDEMYNLLPKTKATLTEVEASVDHLKKELESVLTSFVNTGIIPVADREQLEKFDKSF